MVTQQSLIFPESAKLQPKVEENIVLPKKKGLITEEFFDYNIAGIMKYGYTVGDPGHTIRTMKFKCDEYYPFYSLGFTPQLDTSLTLSLAQKNLERSEYERTYELQKWKDNKVYIGFIRTCLAKKYYNLLLFLNHNQVKDSKTSDNIKRQLISTFRTFVCNTCYNPHFSTQYITITGPMQVLFDSIRMTNSWVTYYSRRTNKNEAQKIYLGNMYFLSEVELSYSSGISNVRPLFCLMVKKEYMPVIRAHFISNIPIPASMLELWIDKSLEGEGSKMKPHFRKFIKSKLEGSGVQVKYFDSLKEQLIEELRIPTFSTIGAKHEWHQGLLQSWYDVQLGKCTYKQAAWEGSIDNRTATILRVFEKELEDVSASIS